MHIFVYMLVLFESHVFGLRDEADQLALVRGEKGIKPPLNVLVFLCHGSDSVLGPRERSSARRLTVTTSPCFPVG